MARMRGAREACGSSIRDGPCDPLSASHLPFASPYGTAGIRQALEFIDAHLGERLTLVRMAGEVRLSPYHFAHVFKRQLGVAPHQYVTQRRLERAKQLLAQTKLPIAAIAAELGFASQSHFSEVFHRETGVTPLSFRLHR